MDPSMAFISPYFKRYKRTDRYAPRLLDLCHIIGMRPRYTALHAAYYAAALTLAIKMMMRHHVDNIYMMSQPIAVQTATSLF